MKNIVFRAFAAVMILMGLLIPKQAFMQEKLQGKITISGAFALYPMMVRWADEFRKLHPGLRIDVSAGGAGKGMTDALGGMVDIGMVSREVYPAETKKGAFAVAVARDAVVPVINAKNPALKDILARGITASVARKIWITEEYKTWNEAFRIKQKIPLHVYTRSDACGAAEIWGKYQGGKQEDLNGSGVFGDPGLALAVKRDPAGIGFNNIGYAYDQTTHRQVEGIRVLPIDLNGNGKIDPNEVFYETMSQITDAIAAGKYPSPPARDLYLVTKGKPAAPAVKAFIKWILTSGQQFVREAGYIRLPDSQLQDQLKNL
ncbi:MAG TPA: phosphate ABC transporter substrate-binding protein [Bacteroidales bacterium]|nr:MAG: phosphate ABC transporter substrate-binding protein [Bacteroidetes bacterium GWE2_42_24]OFY26343.1 MAG: phosphate ABC transporter substrate-binding protein [Bacteroidetes bacterium GWF2_43_11]HAQ65598.1 phosphate ABC transporter substrate-binding protein [Bacteroidales bacterium]HBZ66904.1 phosphate ABC transporter substrate-binding protein [Bacteroidales bacterium]